ncbi:hypothetical protein [Candidatus Aciduliprofundum boonei]|uniref:Uncharacterized protein n=1 Tax=Aciduliprofundum boonei (strain DSM 19572 / T469) TaxID=439481 RepID=B5ICI1_ACIB4|nr:hypothetical protein [Candidatus Aciduliprofundum boonei]ADD09058.1 hypothetical protein Aboo_1250 [Aciduliprofundum boonei T469]EDY36049.1 hypothetical protein ABOONEI_3010 [Aciduliprofundum boonei T469]HII55284.1 hypothetical protein [Candidatus Aciduliprofundum boonei]
MDRELRRKVIRLTFTILGYLMALMFLLGGIVDLLIHLWLSSAIMLSISIILFLLTFYLYIGTSLYVIFEDSVYVPRLYRHGDAKKKEIMELRDVKKVLEIKGFLREGFLFYVSQKGYYFIKRSVFNEIREKLPSKVKIIWLKKS